MDGTAKLIFVLGGPGAGKGTQCLRIIADYPNFVHLSAGDLLRKERMSGSANGELIQKCIDEGSIVPAEITVALIRQAMREAGWTTKRFLVDGFPRNDDNYLTWFRLSPDVDVEYCLFLDCDPDKMVERIGMRGGTRSDDNPDVVKKRLVTYNEQTRPIIERFEVQGKLLRVDVNGTQDEAYQNTIRGLGLIS
ncbi:unnamed protein product [Blepharisma stoltei]|uniref:Uncharacterized protein n=1 Tax=Blepharisma stoltei TaxID=1481888 RepID=A0AAU9JX50_9CILI|nr:unnamed protein product [Blepharisma stoltei]